jgi:hypothetical protein
VPGVTYNSVPLSYHPRHLTESRPRQWTLLRAGLLVCLGGWASGQGVPQLAVNKAVDRGVEYLLAKQQLDGTWNHGKKPRIGCTALILYTLLSSGVDPLSPAVELAATHLEHEPLPDKTYDCALMIMALSAHDPKRHRDQLEDLVERLVGWEERGGWGYPAAPGNQDLGWQDLSNTQYAVMGLWAAARAGIRVPKGIWGPVAYGLKRYSGSDGGFAYTQAGQTSTGSMTAAGVAALAICRDQLGLDPEQRRKDKYGALDAIDEGSSWLGAHFSVTRNPQRSGGHLGYYLYGLERAGALIPTTQFGNHLWYEEGARQLVADQNPTGNWRSTLGGGLPETCFGLLFLRKATAPRTGLAAKGGAGGTEVSLLRGASPVHLTVSGLKPASMWINGYSPDVLRACEWPGEEGQGMRVERVIWSIDGIEHKRIGGDVSQPSAHERFACQYEFDQPGVHKVEAEVHLLRAPTRDGSGRLVPSAIKVVRSTELIVEVESGCPDWMIQNARDRSANLLAGVQMRVTASSISGSYGAHRAVDHDQGTFWLAEAGDENPTLTIELDSDVTANMVVVGHPHSGSTRKNAHGLALEVLVTVNETSTYRLRMHSEEGRKGRLRLPGTRRIKRLDISIPWRVPGPNGSRTVGLAEVELQQMR